MPLSGLLMRIVLVHFIRNHSVQSLCVSTTLSFCTQRLSLLSHSLRGCSSVWTELQWSLAYFANVKITFWRGKFANFCEKQALALP